MDKSVGFIDEPRPARATGALNGFIFVEAAWLTTSFGPFWMNELLIHLGL